MFTVRKSNRLIFPALCLCINSACAAQATQTESVPIFTRLDPKLIEAALPTLQEEIKGHKGCFEELLFSFDSGEKVRLDLRVKDEFYNSKMCGVSRGYILGLDGKVIRKIYER